MPVQNGNVDHFKSGLSWIMSKKVLPSMNFYMHECVPQGGVVGVLVGNVCFPRFLYVMSLLVVSRVLFSLFQRTV